ncbi:MAG: hypothetical protein U1E26_10170 [Coriobacteriia bacterium]|nr:hypothetical protein [Coriobacteriia bacterium]
MIEAITRFVLVAAGLLGGYAITQSFNWQAELGLDPNYVIFLFVILGGASGFVLGGIVGRELDTAWGRLEARLGEVALAELILGTVGLIVGLTIAFFAAQPLRLLEPVWLAIAVTALLSIVAGYLGISLAMTRRKEFGALFPRFASTASETSSAMLALDTSTVIDGRFPEMRELGFLTGELRVPRFVLAELQTLADSADDGRRSRGRRGLDLLVTLPAERAVSVLEVDYSDLAGVDEKLMRLATESGATIVTVDHNLSQVARVRGIRVLNLNEAAAALRPTFLPGDGLRLRVAKAGKEAGQGVGYLEDGTMVVVHDGQPLIGQDALLEVTSVLQTAGGRMIFARPTEPVDPQGHPE